jgi:hypothetical protein
MDIGSVGGGGMPAVTNGPFDQAANDKISELMRRAEKAMGVRLLWQPIFQDCFNYVLPQRQSFYANTEGQRRTDLIFDATAVVANMEFASRLQAYVLPVFAKWADLVAGPDVPPAQRDQVDMACEAVTEYCFDVIQNSNFDAAVNECLLEFGIGTACLVIDEGHAADEPINCTALSLVEYAIENGIDGRTGAIYRERKIKWRDIEPTWPGATLSEAAKDIIKRTPDEETVLLESTIRDYSFRGEELWDHSVIIKQMREEIFGGIYRGEGSCPYIVFHWAKAPGDTWGRGPVMNTLPDIKVLNLVTQMLLENAELAIAGLWQADDDGVINVDTISLEPGTVIPKAVGSSGLTPLTPGSRFDIAQFVIKEMKDAIKHGLYTEPLGSMQDSRIQSAQEVVERMADISRRVGSSFGRMQAELVQNAVRRLIYILRKQGRIKLPLVNGRVIRVRPVTPLARSQAQEEVLRFDRLAQMIMERFGPGSVNTMLRGEEAAGWLADNMGVPHRLVRSAGEQRQIQAKALAQMQQAGADPAEVMTAMGAPQSK